MRTIPALCSAAIALLMVSCVSPIVKRIERNPEIFNGLSAEHKELVRRGQIEEGMTRKAVFIAWGKPDHASKGSQNGKAYERWSYAGYQPSYTTGAGFGVGVNQFSQRAYSRGCYSYDRSFYYEPMVTYVPYEAARVEFLNGIVSGWSASR